MTLPAEIPDTALAGGGAQDQAGTINDAYAAYQKQLNPYLQQSYLDPMSICRASAMR